MIFKMWRVTYFVCLIFVYHVNENLAEVSHPYIVSIKLKLQKERIPRLIVESLCGNNNILAPYFDYSNVSFNDVAEIIGGKNVTLKEALEELNFGFTNVSNMISRNNLENIIETTDINLHHLYSMFVQYFVKSPMKDVPKILNYLNIDNDKFATAVVFGTDKEMLKILVEGSYTRKNVEKALEVVNKDVTLKEVFNFVQFARLCEALKAIRNASASIYLFESLKSLFVVNKVVQFLNFLNVSANDFYRNDAFGKVLTNCVDTKEELIGSVTSFTSITTNSNSKTLIDYEYLKNYTQLIATPIENPDIQHTILNISMPVLSNSTTLLIIDKSDLQQCLDVSSNIESVNLKNCTYVSLNAKCNSLYIENVVARLGENNFAIINKTNNTPFHVGSPLLCGNRLHGVADWETDSTISFILANFDVGPYNYNPEGYLVIVMNVVKQARAVVLGGICNVLKYFNVNICSHISLA